MSREGKKVRTVMRTLLVAAVAVAAAISLVLSTGIRHAASTTPVAPAAANDRAVAPAERVSDKPYKPALEGNTDSRGNSDPLVIREAHSDGGYWEWLERQPAKGGTGGH